MIIKQFLVTRVHLGNQPDTFLLQEYLKDMYLKICISKMCLLSLFFLFWYLQMTSLFGVVLKSRSSHLLLNLKQRNETTLVLILVGKNKAGYTATLVACGWAGAVIDKVTEAFGQEQ